MAGVLGKNNWHDNYFYIMDLFSWGVSQLKLRNTHHTSTEHSEQV